MTTLSTSDFDAIRSLMQEYASIEMGDAQRSLLSARFDAMACRGQFGTRDEMLTLLRSRPISDVHRKIAESLLNHETSFFRDAKCFRALETEVLPRAISANSDIRKLSIWSAGCSTGQEAFSVAMLMLERFPQLGGWEIDILATDISSEVVERAKSGHFSQIEVNRGLPARLMLKYFSQLPEGWQLSEILQKKVKFLSFDLAKTWPALPRMDIVLLRNILIYLNGEARMEITRQMAETLKPGGSLVVGSVESLLKIDHRFKLDTSGGYTYYTLDE
jgi:chemotaxis protein methyltransferase CheR